jgi:hypothetical protein
MRPVVRISGPSRSRTLQPLIAEADRSRLDMVLNESAVNLRDRSAAWQKSGWTSFDPPSKPYGVEEIRKERELY